MVVPLRDVVVFGAAGVISPRVVNGLLTLMMRLIEPQASGVESRAQLTAQDKAFSPPFDNDRWRCAYQTYDA